MGNLVTSGVTIMANTRLYWLHCLSPTHAGIGRGLGYIDLPIERDAVTGWPIIRGSAFKGVWADHFGATDDNRKKNATLRAAFGISGAEQESNSGALVPSDARLVCLPIRSFRGTFAWASSPLCLHMLKRTLELSGLSSVPAAPSNVTDQKAHHTTSTTLKEGSRIYLEDLDFEAVQCQTATAWADLIAGHVFNDDSGWAEQFKKRFVVLPDLAFDYLCQTGTEVHTRVRIDDETKTVAEGALWTEESLPAETILMGVVSCDRIFGRNGKEITANGLLDQFADKTLTLQIGGKATVGRGQVRCIFRRI